MRMASVRRPAYRAVGVRRRRMAVVLSAVTVKVAAVWRDAFSRFLRASSWAPLIYYMRALSASPTNPRLNALTAYPNDNGSCANECSSPTTASRGTRGKCHSSGSGTSAVITLHGAGKRASATSVFSTSSGNRLNSHGTMASTTFSSSHAAIMFRAFKYRAVRSLA